MIKLSAEQMDFLKDEFGINNIDHNNIREPLNKKHSNKRIHVPKSRMANYTAENVSFSRVPTTNAEYYPARISRITVYNFIIFPDKLMRFIDIVNICRCRCY